jgi:hypothetical protein
MDQNQQQREDFCKENGHNYIPKQRRVDHKRCTHCGYKPISQNSYEDDGPACARMHPGKTCGEWMRSL